MGTLRAGVVVVGLLLIAGTLVVGQAARSGRATAPAQSAAPQKTLTAQGFTAVAVLYGGQWALTGMYGRYTPAAMGATCDEISGYPDPQARLLADACRGYQRYLEDFQRIYACSGACRVAAAQATAAALHDVGVAEEQLEGRLLPGDCLALVRTTVNLNAGMSSAMSGLADAAAGGGGAAVRRAQRRLNAWFRYGDALFHARQWLDVACDPNSTAAVPQRLRGFLR